MKEKILKTARERRHIMQEKKKKEQKKKNKAAHFFSETLPSEETAKLSLMYET